jgi:lactoylglutathione lyase
MSPRSFMKSTASYHQKMGDETVIRVSHVALWVDDLERARGFYEQWFGARAGQRYSSARRPLETYFLSLGEGAQIELMKSPTEAPRPAHLAISVGSQEAVDRLHQEMQAAGVVILGAPRYTGDGMYEMVVADSAGNPVEITA